MRGYDKHKQEILKRLRRIEGQVRGLQRMVEQDSYCIDVLTQITAANSALKSVAVGLLEDHIGNCVARGGKAKGSEGDEIVAEASAAIARLVRS